MNGPGPSARDLAAAVDAGGGALVAEPAIVFRDTYRGRGILADNRTWDSAAADERGFLPVEWWIMSRTPAENTVPREGEGITTLRVGADRVPLDRALARAPWLLGDAAPRWPLIKLLDIGGEPVRPDFGSAPEVPPIPVHVHGGVVRDGRLVGPGKHEAYFFPPTDVRGVDLGDGAITRLGVRPEVSREEFREAVAAFGTTDRAYALLNEFAIAPFDGWEIRPGIVHAPGPWPTVEVQTPQDDFNLLAWQLGLRLDGARRREAFERFVLRGLPDVDAVLDRVVDWAASADPRFRERAHRPAREVERASWGRRFVTFHGRFAGELLVFEPGAGLRLPADREPRALAVWAGEGRVGVHDAGAVSGAAQEFLVPPGREVALASGRDAPLWLLTFGPMRTDSG
ncbi:MAG: hypothetical protein D6738_04140 [Acidobacteria bacterium]|nr:MAG: hypothetical protein D6738_04140 [Acidobacteriota bacterium]